MSLFNNLTEEDKSLAVEKIMKGSMPNHDFYDGYIVCYYGHSRPFAQ